MNLFDARADWHVPPLPTPIVRVATAAQVNPDKPEVSCVAAIPRAMTRQKSVIKPMIEKCAWGTGCPICKEEENIKQKKLHHCLQNNQHPQSYNAPDCYEENIRLKREWEEKMERLNEKCGLNYYSRSGSESD